MQIKIAKHVCFLIATFLLIFIVFNSCKKVHETNPYSGTLPSILIDSLTSKMNVVAKLVDSTGKPLQELWFTIRATSDSFDFYSQHGYTDSTGHISATALHVRTVYTLKVYQYDFCGAPIFSKNITTPNTYQTDVDLGNFIVEPVSTIITGTVVDCNNNPVKDGTITVEADIYNTDRNNSNLIIQKEYHSSINPDGTFKLPFPVCSTKTDSVPATIYVEDATGLQVGNQVCYSVHYPESNIGKIQGCNSIDTAQFFNITVDSTVHFSFYPSQFIETPGDLTSTFIIGQTSPSGNDFRLFGFLAVNKPGLKEVQLEFAQYENALSSEIVNINEYGPVGGFIAGTFQAQVFHVTDRTFHVATVSFRVKRKQ